jgi:hypothetical protein
MPQVVDALIAAPEGSRKAAVANAGAVSAGAGAVALASVGASSISGCRPSCGDLDGEAQDRPDGRHRYLGSADPDWHAVEALNPWSQLHRAFP